MAAISQKIGSIIGGVSQQPDTVKFAGQLRVCDNYYPDVALGLIKRPGLQGIKQLTNAVANGTWAMIFRDDAEKYIVQFSNAGALKIWSANNGLQQTVNAVAAESTTYAVHNSQDDLQLLQINDYIFVLNRNITVAASATTSATQNPFAFVAINTVAYSSTYTVKLDGTDYSYATTTTSGTQLNVQDITAGLIAAIPSGTYTCVAIGNNIHIKRVNNADFSIEAKGGNAGTSIEAFKGSVSAVAQLPKQFVNNTKLKVAGSADATEDDYWVIFKTSDNSNYGAGIWEETIAPNIPLKLNEETMPHVIIREANGTFTYRKLDEASAAASAGTTTVAGIPSAVSILSSTTGGHSVGEIFAPTGGTGSNLRLRVERVRSNTVSNSYAYNSNSYVQQVTTTTTTPGWRGIGGGTTTTVEYRWYLNGTLVGTTTDDDLVQGSTTYIPNGAFQPYQNQTRAGITVVRVTNGIIDQVSIRQAGQGYTALNTVANTSGDTFRIDSINSNPLEGDASRLNYWKPRAVGDTETNPMPTFVGFPLDAMSFFKNRLILTSRQNVICSQAGDYFNFFASTVITIVDSDPIDISASSLTPIRLKHALPTPRAVLLFGDNAQYILETTTEAFSPKTAEVNRLASFSLSANISPVDLGSSYAFLQEGEKVSSIYEMDIKDNVGGKPDVIELTRIIPNYIPSAVRNMKFSSSANTLAILSAADTTTDLRYLYMWRYFQNGDNRISGWFRWKLPGTIEHFDFDQDILYVITKHGSNYVLSKVSLLTETPNESLLFEGQYLDVRLDLFDYSPTITYELASNTTRVCFKEGFNDTNEQAVLMYLSSNSAGYFEEQTIQYDASRPTGQKYYLEVEGNETAAGGLSTVTRTAGSTTATVTCTSEHRLITGNTITVIAGVAAGTYTVTVLTTTTFTITTVATTALNAINFIFSSTLTATTFALGYKYESTAQLPAFYVVKDSSRTDVKDTLNIPRISRLNINSYNSGPYKVNVNTEGRNQFSLQLPQITANYSEANTLPIIRNAQSSVPILAKGNQVEVQLIADSPFPTAFTSIDWEGTYNNKGIQSL